MDPAKLRWIGYSHFEVDECGAINEWLANAPGAEAVTGFVGALVNLNDFASRPARILKENETFATGKYRFRYLATPHLPHGWDAGVMFEETQGTLFCSDLFHQVGDLEPITESDLIGRVRAALTEYQAGPLMDYQPFTPRTGKQLEKLAELKPRTLAAMHGSAFSGDGARALRDLRNVMSEVLGGEALRHQ
jgi:flavorubredoxin